MSSKSIIMSNDSERNYVLSDLTKGYSLLFILFFSFASTFVLFYSLISESYYINFVLIPIIGVILLTIYYLKINSPVESLNRLILIDLIIFLLYLTSILLVYIIFLEPLSYFIYYILLGFIYMFYFGLLIPLVGIIYFTILYLRLNTRNAGKKYYIVIIFLGLIIVLFIVNYYLLDWSLPIIDNLLRPEWD